MLTKLLFLWIRFYDEERENFTSCIKKEIQKRVQSQLNCTTGLLKSLNLIDKPQCKDVKAGFVQFEVAYEIFMKANQGPGKN